MTETITFEIDPALKKEAESICEDMGITLATSYLMFTKAMVRLRALPFKAKAGAKSLFAKEEKKPIDKKEKQKEQALAALIKVQTALKGAAERAGFKNEEELQRYAKDVVRQEIWEERYAKSLA